MELFPAPLWKSNVRSLWTRYRWFPWIEWREHQYQINGVVVASTIERRWYQKPTQLPRSNIKLPEPFNWQRDYGPLWKPGSTAFWLEPEPGDLPAGQWPLPFIKERTKVIVFTCCI